MLLDLARTKRVKLECHSGIRAQTPYAMFCFGRISHHHTPTGPSGDLPRPQKYPKQWHPKMKGKGSTLWSIMLGTLEVQVAHCQATHPLKLSSERFAEQTSASSRQSMAERAPKSLQTTPEHDLKAPGIPIRSIFPNSLPLLLLAAQKPYLPHVRVLWAVG